MVNPSISKPATTILGETRAQVHQWGGQLGQLLGWLLVIEFGLMSVALGLIVVNWPATPRVIASAAGAWLLLLAGCRGLAALAAFPFRSARTRAAAGASAGLVDRPGSAGLVDRPGSAGRVDRTGSAGSVDRPGSAQAVERPGSVVQSRRVGFFDARSRRPGRRPADPRRAEPRPFDPPASAGGWLFGSSGARRPSAAGSAGLKVAVIEAGCCVVTGFVLLHAAWPSRPEAIPLALALAGVVILICAALDVLVARFGADRDPRERLVRAVVWMASALLLMALARSAAPAALATAAVLIGLVETALGGWMLNRAVQARRARTAAARRTRPDHDSAPFVDFLTGTGPVPDIWPIPVPSETV